MTSDRTIFVKPIHHNASDEDVKAFFAPYGTVESLERFSTFKKPNSLPNAAFLVFTEAQPVERCIKSKISYGQLDGIGNHFVPKLFMCTKDEYERRQQDEQELKKRKQMRDQSDEPEKKKEKTEKSPVIGENCVLKASEIPSNITWRDIKAMLGDYLKGVAHIAFVIHDSSKDQAYIVMKTAEGVAAAMKIFNDTEHPQSARLHKVIPVLMELEGEEEATVRENFSKQTYGGAKTEKKSSE